MAKCNVKKNKANSEDIWAFGSPCPPPYRLKSKLFILKSMEVFNKDYVL